MRAPSLIVCFLLAAGLPAQVAKPAAAKKGRPVGGAVALVHTHTSPIRECVVSSDGSTSVVCTADGMVHFTRITDRFGKPKPKGKPKGKGKKWENDNRFQFGISNVLLTSDGQRLIGRINASSLAILTKKPRILHQLRGLPKVNVVTMHPDGKQLVAGMTTGLLRSYDTEAGKPTGYLVFNNKPPSWVGFTPDGTQIMLATEDRKLRYFSFPGGAKKAEVDTKEPVHHMSFTKDGKTMLSQSGDDVQVWTVADPTINRTLEIEKPAVRVAVTPGGKQFVVAHEDGTVTLCGIEDGKPVLSWPAHPGKKIICLQFIEQKKPGLLLVTAAKGGDVVFWKPVELRKAYGPKKGKKKRRKKGR